MSFCYTDDWKPYKKHILAHKYFISKKNTQKNERQNLNFKTYIADFAEKLSAFLSIYAYFLQGEIITKYTSSRLPTIFLGGILKKYRSTLAFHGNTKMNRKIRK